MSKTSKKAGNHWAVPVAVDGLQLAFGADLERLLPPWNEIPEKYKDHDHPMSAVVTRWFFSGLPKGTRFVPRPGIDKNVALRQVATCLRSFEPQHEHKKAGVAYLLDLFFEAINVPLELPERERFRPATRPFDK